MKRFETIDAMNVLSAVGDAFGGHPIGFSMRVANVAARFAVYRERPQEIVTATFCAAALHRIGAIRIVVPRDASRRETEISRWDDPPSGAAFISSTGMFPVATADAVRWHREAFDGTGFPDRLRWSGIPDSSMSINIVRAFIAARDALGAHSSSADAVFMLVEASGCIFTLAVMREFREFLAAESDAYDAPYMPANMPENLDGGALLKLVCREIDARSERTRGRGDRLERIVRAICATLDNPAIDPDRAVWASRLTALGRTGLDGGADDALTLTRLGLESRAEHAALNAHILATGAAFAAYAPSVGSIEEWHDGSGLPEGRAGTMIDPIARILAVAIAAEAVTAPDAKRRIMAAAGTRLDPAMVSAYLATESAR